MPMPMPMSPPTRLMIAASDRNIFMMWPLWAPMALRIPTSRFRSLARAVKVDQARRMARAEEIRMVYPGHGDPFTMETLIEILADAEDS